MACALQSGTVITSLILVEKFLQKFFGDTENRKNGPICHIKSTVQNESSSLLTMFTYSQTNLKTRKNENENFVFKQGQYKM